MSPFFANPLISRHEPPMISMYLKIGSVKLLASLVLYLFSFTGIAEGFSHQHVPPPAAGEDLFNKLNIIQEKTKVPSPDFTLNDPDGKPVRLGELKGKVVFLNFWATWCPPCIIEMPSMEKLHREFGDKSLMILAINVRESAKQVKAFVKSHKLTLKTLLDPKGTVSRRYYAWALPVTVIVNKRGEKIYTVIGPRDWDTQDANNFVQQLLEEN